MADAVTDKMHERISTLETNHKVVIGRIDSVENSVSALSLKVDKVLEFIQEARVRQLPPVNTIIVTIVATLTLISMTVGGLFWLVDSRVGFGVQRANYFVSQLSDGPENIYVRIHDLDSRVKRIESPLAK
jgi:hypothetical protein